MKKSLIALAAVGAFAGSAMAQTATSSLTIYGIVDLGLVKQSKPDDVTSGFALGGPGVATKQTSVNQATKSRLGFKGVEDLGGGLSAKFELEHRLLPDTGATNPSGANQFWDKSIVGLTSQTYGEVTIGRDYGPTFYVQYLLDPWLNQGIAEVGGTNMAFAGYNAGGHNVRYNNGIFYKAIYEGLTVMVAGAPSETYGKDARMGLGLMYNAGPLGVYFAYDREQTAVPGKTDTDNLMQLGASYDFGMIKPRILYAQSKLMTPFDGQIKPRSLTISATVPVSTGLIKVGYAQMNWKGASGADQAIYAGTVASTTTTAAQKLAAGTAGTLLAASGKDTKNSKFSLGYEHTLSKRTALYTDVTFGKTKDGVVNANGTIGNASASGVDLGIRHSF
jgi:predicted porin